MKNDTFTIFDYIQAIQRELGKRVSTYPKILKKMKKRGESFALTAKMQSEQMAVLNSVGVFLTCGSGIKEDMMHIALSELIRELKMRKSYYPRLIWLDRNSKSPRMTKETADYEIAVWESLTRWFAKEYLYLNELPTGRRKKQ